MSIFSVSNVSMCAVASCVPEQAVQVVDYSLFTPEEAALFSKTTGVYSRRFAKKEVCASDMGVMAAQRLFEITETTPQDIDVLIFVTQSPDYILPASSLIIHKNLKLGKHVIAFDINLGCSGFVYGMSIISALIGLNGMRKGLLICGDKSSPSLSFTDKSTYPLFGDGVSAILFEHDINAKPMWFNLQSDGTGFDKIIIPGGATRNLPDEHTFEKKSLAEGIERCMRDLHLDGADVFNFALREVKPNIQALLEKSNTDIHSIDYVVMHQANKLMNESVRKKLGVDADKTLYSLERYGNTSSASIPLTITANLSEQKTGHRKWLLSGFGVGYSWGSAYIETNDLVVCPMVEWG